MRVLYKEDSSSDEDIDDNIEGGELKELSVLLDLLNLKESTLKSIPEKKGRETTMFHDFNVQEKLQLVHFIRSIMIEACKKVFHVIQMVYLKPFYWLLQLEIQS